MNELNSNVLKDDLDVLNRGWYSKPHGLITLLQKKCLTKSEYILMDFLLAFENRYMQADGWFWSPDKVIIATGLLSSKTIVKARNGLISKGFIEIQQGYSGHATEYRILLDKSTYFRGGSSM
jgi:hypothetical protein